MTEYRFAHLTCNEHCLAALDRVLDERRTPVLGERRIPAADHDVFAEGFVEGWRERGIAAPGTVTITREQYADLERRAGGRETRAKNTGRYTTPSDVLGAADLPTLRRVAAHYRARAAHRGIAGRIVCHILAATCDRIIRSIVQHGEMRPEVDYHRSGAR